MMVKAASTQEMLTQAREFISTYIDLGLAADVLSNAARLSLSITHAAGEDEEMSKYHASEMDEHQHHFAHHANH
jgi:hypothetical protein